MMQNFRKYNIQEIYIRNLKILFYFLTEFTFLLKNLKYLLNFKVYFIILWKI